MNKRDLDLIKEGMSLARRRNVWISFSFFLLVLGVLLVPGVIDWLSSHAEYFVVRMVAAITMVYALIGVFYNDDVRVKRANRHGLEKPKVMEDTMGTAALLGTLLWVLSTGAVLISPIQLWLILVLSSVGGTLLMTAVYLMPNSSEYGQELKRLINEDRSNMKRLKKKPPSS